MSLTINELIARARDAERRKVATALEEFADRILGENMYRPRIVRKVRAMARRLRTEKENEDEEQEGDDQG